MEKIIYALWRSDAVDAAAFKQQLLGEVAEALGPHVLALRINVADEDVVGGTVPRIANIRPQMDAVIQLWVHCSHDPYRAAIDEIVGRAAPRFAAWLVCESVPLPNELHPPVKGKRTEGFSQLAFIGQPPKMSHEEFAYQWRRVQTAVAIETQSNFEYRQNLVVRPLTYGAPPFVAIVEECFPAAAFHDEAAYYDGPGDPAKWQENKRLMFEACAQFMDFERIDVIQTSQFDLRPIGE
ncbi:MAG: EthD domain-containing protein [Sphingomonas sp.]|nr:EthD domain-containing protein [Sphingomonas sp.]MDX3883779.1 EthD domain-containing protein [Sphingomonas sp.]